MPISNDYHRLENSLRQPVAGAKRLGPLDANEILPVTITLRRRPGAPSLPDQEHWASIPPGERKFISDAEFADRYGAAPADLESVAQFVRGQGLTVVETDLSQRTVVVSGTAADLNKAFAVELGLYEADAISETSPRHPRTPEKPQPTKNKKEERADRDKKDDRPDKTIYVGYEGYVHVPEQLSNIVEAVFGLDRRRLARRAITPFPAISPLTPPQVAKLYDFPSPASHMHHQTIGLFEFGDPIIGKCGYYPSDVTAYFTTPLGIGPGFIPPTLTDIGVNGAANSPGGFDDIEVALDIQVAGAVAQGAHINVYFTTWDENGWVLAIKRAVHPKAGERRPSVISISWAWAEFESFGALTWSQAVIDAVSTAFQEAAMFGITVFAASGDYGSSAGIFGPTARVAYPESDPWVTSVGGTTIGNVAGSSFTEVTWVESAAEFGTTGGGISDVFHLPFWQHHHNVPLSVNPGHRKGRGTPDIAGYASGYSIVYAGSTETNVQGTSEAAPLYAGLIALINAHLGERVGYLNPVFYSHHLKHCFRDIADGRNNSDFGAPGYTSVPGWDACTGLGSLNGRALLKALERRHREEVHALSGEEGFTGKVAGLVFDRFGEFEGFLLAEFHGGERKFESREKDVHLVVSRAWTDHVTTTVLVRDKEPQHPVSIILRGRA
jgi:kumamolisin